MLFARIVTQLLLVEEFNRIMRERLLFYSQLGLSCHVILRSAHEGPERVGWNDNLLLHRMSGSQIHITKLGAGLQDKMDALTKKLSRNENVRPYGICIGGSDAIGVWGI